MPRTATTSHAGFTLIELLIAVSIVAILAAIAYPSYQEQVRKGNRADAKASLMEAAQQLERCFSKDNTYVDCTFRTTSEGGKFTISTSAVAATTFTLQAVASAANHHNDTTCAKFTINHTGQRSATNSANADSTSSCW